MFCHHNRKGTKTLLIFALPPSFPASALQWPPAPTGTHQHPLVPTSIYWCPQAFTGAHKHLLGPTSTHWDPPAPTGTHQHPLEPTSTHWQPEPYPSLPITSSDPSPLVYPPLPVSTSLSVSSKSSLGFLAPPSPLPDTAAKPVGLITP